MLVTSKVKTGKDSILFELVQNIQIKTQQINQILKRSDA